MSKVLQWVVNQSWAILPDTLSAMVELVEKRVDLKEDFTIKDSKDFHLTEVESIEAFNSSFGTRLEGSYYTVQRGSVAILPVVGAIFPRSGLMTMSGGMSVSSIERELKLIVANDEIKSIILNMDTPGGAITGISEITELIKKIGTTKPVTAYIYGYGASAGYWIASGASKIVGSNTSQVGCLGVMTGYTDRSKADEKNGIKKITFISSQTPNKNLDPSTDAGRIETQSDIDALAEIFLSTVAINRKLPLEKIKSSFGKGSMILAEKAVELGMMDSVSTLEALIEQENINNGLTNNNFLGGSEMTMNITSLQKDHPAVYAEVLAIGVASGKEANFKAGSLAENDRLKKIEAIKAPGHDELIAGLKYDMSQTAETISFAILNKQAETQKAVKDGIAVDGVKTAEQIAQIKQEDDKIEPVDAKAEDAMVANMVDGAKNV